MNHSPVGLAAWIMSFMAGMGGGRDRRTLWSRRADHRHHDLLAHRDDRRSGYSQKAMQPPSSRAPIRLASTRGLKQNAADTAAAFWLAEPGEVAGPMPTI